MRSQLPKDFDVDTHFAPRYDPWDQRMCGATLSVDGVARQLPDTLSYRGMMLSGVPNFAHVQRSVKELPAQGSKRPWQMRQNYPLDMLDIRRAALEDGVLTFSAGRPGAPRQPEPAAA